MKKKNSFTVPKLCNRVNDLSKSWYVYFTYTDDLGNWKQFRYKHELNSYKTKREREREAGSMIAVLHNRLLDGWNPFIDKIEKEKEDETVSQAIRNILAIKKSTITKRSYKTYSDLIGLFEKWLIQKKYDKLFIQNFTNKHARQYFDWLLLDKKYCGRTFNCHRANLNVFFNALVERQVISESPIKGIKKRPEERGKNTTFSKEDEIKFINYAKDHEKNFYYATRFIKYCFFRRPELVGLQRKHINWDNKTIVIDSEIAKSNRQDSITIPKTLEKIILEMDILKLDPETYIFGKITSRQSGPSLIKQSRVEGFSDKQLEINKLLEITRGTFYSWKHTGVCELYNSLKDKDIYVIMRQCRHTNINMTMIYLRSLGLGVNEQVREW